MRKNKKYNYEIRKCPICGMREQNEELCDISSKRIGKKYKHDITTKISICKKCGFVYATQVIPQKELDEYYNDMYVGFRSEEVYSVDNRIDLIEKYKQSDECIIEIGGNEQGLFSQKLKKLYNKYYSYDINQSADNMVDSMEELPKTDMLVAYCVLEHISDIASFLERCISLINKNGIFILEVPNLNEYYRNASGLTFCEHVNHFTPESLTKLMANYGFSLVEISRTLASREIVFAGVYRKEEKTETCIEYNVSRAYIQEGLDAKIREEANLKKVINKIYTLNGEKNLKNMVFWCANDICTTLIDEYLKMYGLFEALVIDEDEKKKNYLELFPVYMSKDVFESDKGNNVKSVLICSYTRVNSVVDTIRKYGKKVKILYIDKEKNLAEWIG